MTIFMARIRMYKRCLRGPGQLLYCGPFCYTNGLLDLPLLVLCRPNSKLCVLHVVYITIITVGLDNSSGTQVVGVIVVLLFRQSSSSSSAILLVLDRQRGKKQVRGDCHSSALVFWD